MFTGILGLGGFAAIIYALYCAIKAAIHKKKNNSDYRNLNKNSLIGLGVGILCIVLISFVPNGRHKSNNKSTASSSSLDRSSSVYDKDARENWRKRHLTASEKKEFDNYREFVSKGLPEIKKHSDEIMDIKMSDGFITATTYDMKPKPSDTEKAMQDILKVYKEYTPINGNDFDGDILLTNAHDEQVATATIANNKITNYNYNLD